MSSRVVEVLIGATLKGSFRSNIGAARREVNELGKAVKKADDQLKKSPGSKAAEEQAKRLGRAYQEAQRRVEALTRAEERRAARQQRIGEAARAGMAVAGFGAAIAPAITRASDFEHGLASFGVVANATAETLGNVRRQLLDLARATNQQAPDLLAGLQVLVGKGMEMTPALASIQAIGRAATATGATIEDMAKTTFTLIDAMGIKPEGLEQALNILAQAAKEGGFEVKDMAQYFPMLSAAARSLGITGEKGVSSMAAALQIALRGAADPATAANNMQNFFMKMTSEETVKNFNEMGSDLQAILKAAMARGDNPMEVALKEIQRLTGGDPFKMNKLFQDMEVVKFIRPMLQNLEEYRKIRNTAFAARGQGVIDTDFTRMMDTFKEKLKAAAISAGNFGEALGKALIPWLTPVVTGFARIADSATALVERFPNVTAGVVALGGAFLTLRLASVVGSLLGMGSAVSALGTGFTALWGIVLAHPFVALGAAVIGAALLVYKYWEPIKAFMSDLWSSIKAAAEPVINWLGQKLAWVGDLFNRVFGGPSTTPSSGPASASDPAGTGLLARARARNGVGATQAPGVGGAPPAAVGGPAVASPATPAAGTAGNTTNLTVNVPVTVTGTGDAALKREVEEAVRRAAQRAASDARRELND